MSTTKNLCAQIPIDLHERVSEERERLGQTTSEYITNLIQEYYDMIENQKGGIMGVDVFPIRVDADDGLIPRQVFPRKFPCDLQRQFR